MPAFGSTGGGGGGTPDDNSVTSAKIVDDTISTADIANGAVTNAKLANVATATIKGRITAGTGVPEDLSAAQATALLSAVVGDSGSGGTKGLVPAPSAGDAAAGKFLKADGTFAVPTSSFNLLRNPGFRNSGVFSPIARGTSWKSNGAIAGGYFTHGWKICQNGASAGSDTLFTSGGAEGCEILQTNFTTALPCRPVIQYIPANVTKALRGKKVSAQVVVGGTVSARTINLRIVEWVGGSNTPTNYVSSFGSGTFTPYGSNYNVLGTHTVTYSSGGQTLAVEDVTVGASANNLAIVMWSQSMGNSEQLTWTQPSLVTGSTAFYAPPIPSDEANCRMWQRVWVGGMSMTARLVYYDGNYYLAIPGLGSYYDMARTPTISCKVYGTSGGGASSPAFANYGSPGSGQVALGSAGDASFGWTAPTATFTPQLYEGEVFFQCPSGMSFADVSNVWFKAESTVAILISCEM